MSWLALLGEAVRSHCSLYIDWDDVSLAGLGWSDGEEVVGALDHAGSPPFPEGVTHPTHSAAHAARPPLASSPCASLPHSAEPNSPQRQEHVMRLFDAFDFVLRMTPQESEQNEPAVVQLAQRSLDIQTGSPLPAELIVTESALRELLLRDSTLALAQKCIKTLRARPAYGSP